MNYMQWVRFAMVSFLALNERLSGWDSPAAPFALLGHFPLRLSVAYRRKSQNLENSGNSRTVICLGADEFTHQWRLPITPEWRRPTKMLLWFRHIISCTTTDAWSLLDLLARWSGDSDVPSSYDTNFCTQHSHRADRSTCARGDSVSPDWHLVNVTGELRTVHSLTTTY